MSLFASVRRTMGRFSNNHSKAGCGKYPTQASVFVLMSAHEAVSHDGTARGQRGGQTGTRKRPYVDGQQCHRVSQ